MSNQYLVKFEVDEGEWAYASAENPFTYDSKPLIFETKGEAEVYLLRYNNAHVVKQTDIRPMSTEERSRAKVRALINKGI
jgi:hypothetical protein